MRMNFFLSFKTEEFPVESENNFALSLFPFRRRFQGQGKLSSRLSFSRENMLMGNP